MLGHVVDYAFRVFGQVLLAHEVNDSPWLISAWMLFVIVFPSKRTYFFIMVFWRTSRVYG